MAKLITTSVVRGVETGESHGGVYVVDVEGQHVRQVMDFESTGNARQGRDWDRGLRGIAIDGETVYFVASDTLFAFTPDFKLIGSWRNPYLNNAHEMSIYERSLYITSTGYDSIIAFELDEKKFFWALHVDLDRFKFSGSIYDPMGDEGPLLINKLHLNNVHTNEHGMYISGLKSGGMLHFNGEAMSMSVTLPEGIRNAQPFRDGVLFNDSDANAVRYASRTGEEDRALNVPQDDGTGFARGLCRINDRIVAAGSSPSTLSLYDLQESKTLLSVNLSSDIRSAIHGLEVWPF
jgi:hypothetical protein